MVVHIGFFGLWISDMGVVILDLGFYTIYLSFSKSFLCWRISPDLCRWIRKCFLTAMVLQSSTLFTVVLGGY